MASLSSQCTLSFACSPDSKMEPQPAISLSHNDLTLKNESMNVGMQAFNTPSTTCVTGYNFSLPSQSTAVYAPTGITSVANFLNMNSHPRYAYPQGFGVSAVVAPCSQDAFPVVYSPFSPHYVSFPMLPFLQTGNYVPRALPNLLPKTESPRQYTISTASAQPPDVSVTQPELSATATKIEAKADPSTELLPLSQPSPNQSPSPAAVPKKPIIARNKKPTMALRDSLSKIKMEQIQTEFEKQLRLAHSKGRSQPKDQLYEFVNPAVHNLLQTSIAKICADISAQVRATVTKACEATHNEWLNEVSRSLKGKRKRGETPKPVPHQCADASPTKPLSSGRKQKGPPSIPPDTIIAGLKHDPATCGPRVTDNIELITNYVSMLNGLFNGLEDDCKQAFLTSSIRHQDTIVYFETKAFMTQHVGSPRRFEGILKVLVDAWERWRVEMQRKCPTIYCRFKSTPNKSKKSPQKATPPPSAPKSTKHRITESRDTPQAAVSQSRGKKLTIPTYPSPLRRVSAASRLSFQDDMSQEYEEREASIRNKLRSMELMADPRTELFPNQDVGIESLSQPVLRRFLVALNRFYSLASHHERDTLLAITSADKNCLTTLIYLFLEKEAENLDVDTNSIVDLCLRSVSFNSDEVMNKLKSDVHFPLLFCTFLAWKSFVFDLPFPKHQISAVLTFGCPVRATYPTPVAARAACSDSAVDDSGNETPTDSLDQVDPDSSHYSSQSRHSHRSKRHKDSDEQRSHARRQVTAESLQQQQPVVKRETSTIIRISLRALDAQRRRQRELNSLLMQEMPLPSFCDAGDSSDDDRFNHTNNAQRKVESNQDESTASSVRSTSPTDPMDCEEDVTVDATVDSTADGNSVVDVDVCDLFMSPADSPRTSDREAYMTVNSTLSTPLPVSSSTLTSFSPSPLPAATPFATDSLPSHILTKLQKVSEHLDSVTDIQSLMSLHTAIEPTALNALDKICAHLRFLRGLEVTVQQESSGPNEDAVCLADNHIER
eukprot:GILJ01011676.1.p1 GENE.GILJ01011676.1~~GILJ01011676.1.p1  ORF type:complete len:1003 (+),score=123.93 GILJ01011676.1:42-3050(+)